MTAAAKAILASPDHELAQAQAEILAGAGASAIQRLAPLVDEMDSALPRYWLAAAYGVNGEIEKQRETLREAICDHAARIIAEHKGNIDRMTSDPAYCEGIGTALYQHKLIGAASLAFGALASAPEASRTSLLNYALTLQHLGLMDDAVDAFRIAVARYPHPVVHEFLLYACFFAENGVKLHADAVKEWARLYTPQPDPNLTFARAPLAGRRLRIGYVAPSFTGTQVRQFFLPVLEAHNAKAVEVYLYCEDANAQRHLPAKEITSIGVKADADACARIREDKIDVLIDLWGHTAKGRLGVFALRAAPVQAAWINYVQSTGLATMDYVIHAESMAAPGTANLFSETIWPLGPIMAPFRPDFPFTPSTTPALRTGRVTFGCFNHPAKLSDQTVAAWARILNAMTSAKLVLKYSYFIDPVLQAMTCMRFAVHGVAPDRIEFRGHTTGPEYYAQFADIDLALDPSPCPGGTTSSEAIANGVPLLSLRGDDFYARIAVVHNEPMGMHELVTETWDEYVARALALTADFTALDALRQRIRPAFDASPARDEVGFTRNLEATFRAMFERWQAKQ